MSNGRRFLLDTNVFVQAKNLYYGFDLCPGFWRALLVHHENKRLVSIDRVRDEIMGSGDDLDDWIQGKVPDTFFKQNQAVVKQFAVLVKWVNEQKNFHHGAKREFSDMGEADGWLIAYAKVNGLVLVTHEKHEPEAQKRVPMPNVCLQFGVPFVDVFTMLRELKTRFVLRRPKSSP